MPMIPNQPVGPQGQGSSDLLHELQSEVTTETAPLLQFLMNHAAVIMAGLGLFALGLAALGSYNWYAGNRLQEGQDALARIAIAKQGQERLAALEAFAQQAPARMTVAVQLELAAAAIEVKDYAKASKAYATAAAVAPDSASGLLAAFNQAQSMLAAGKAAEALTVLDALLPRVGEGSETRVRLVQAEAALAAGKPDVALKSFETLAAKAQGAEKEYLESRVFALRAEAGK